MQFNFASSRDGVFAQIDTARNSHEYLLIAEESATTLIESSRFGSLRRSVQSVKALRAEIYKQGQLISAAASFVPFTTNAANDLVKRASDKVGVTVPTFSSPPEPSANQALPALWDRKFIDDTETKLRELLRALPQNIVATVVFHRTIKRLKFFRAESLAQDIRDSWGVALDFYVRGYSSQESLFREDGGSGQPDLDKYISDTLSDINFVVSRMSKKSHIPIETKKFVFSPRAASILFHEAVGHALEEQVLRKVLSSHRGGDQYLPSFINIRDNPNDIHLFGHSHFDDVGRAVQDQLLIKDGRLISCFGERCFAAERGLAPVFSFWRQDLTRPASNRIRNLIIESGKASLDELVFEAEGGVYIERASEGRIDMSNGEFSLFVRESYLIRGRQKTKCLIPFRLVGHLSMLKSGLIGISRDVSQAAMYCNTGGAVCPNGVRSPGCLLFGGRIEPYSGVHNESPRQVSY